MPVSSTVSFLCARWELMSAMCRISCLIKKVVLARRVLVIVIQSVSRYSFVSGFKIDC